MTSMTSNADQHPRDGRRIMNRDQFINEVRPGCHLAEKRKMGYYHHSLVERVMTTCVHVIHYGSTMLGGKIQQKEVSFAEMSFELGVYLIYSNGYPQSQEEREAAIRRAMSRLEEVQYMLSINNCEHFVTWALTRTPLSHQIADATTTRKFAADLFDACVNRKTLICPLSSSLISRGISTLQCGEKATGDIIKKTFETAEQMKPGINTAFGVSTRRNLCLPVRKGAALNGIHSGKIHKKTIVGQSATAINAAVESVLLAKDIYHLRQSHLAGNISGREFKRGICTKISGSIGTYAGCTVGTAIGQILIPLPFVGGFLGGFLGSKIAKEVSSVVTGYVFDNI